MGANGDEIGARLGVIVLLQADRSAVMDDGGFMIGMVHGQLKFTGTWGLTDW